MFLKEVVEEKGVSVCLCLCVCVCVCVCVRERERERERKKSPFSFLVPEKINVLFYRFVFTLIIDIEKTGLLATLYEGY